MLKKEWKENLVSLLIWTLVFVSIFVLVIAIYPSLKMDGESINDLLSAFPQEILDAFNMNDISTPSGWITSEGVLFFLLGGAIYASILGFSTLSKERKNKTIEFLLSKPVSRNKVLSIKLLSGVINLVIFDLVISGVILLGLYLSSGLEVVKISLIVFTPIFVFISFFVLGVLLSFFMKPSKIMGISFGLPFVFYMLVVISKLSDQFYWLNYLTPFTFSDTAYILEHGSLSVFHYVFAIVFIGVITGLSYYVFYKKEAL